MIMKQFLSKLSIAAVAVAVTACGSSGGDGAPVAGAASASVVFGQSAAAIGTPYVGISDEELGSLADVPVTETASLQVLNDFTFDTSRRTIVSMSVPEAVNATAEATFCTDYTSDGVDYDVNYDSCVLQATLHGGELREEINLANQYSSVLGIVWLQDPQAQPIYQEFNFD